MSTLRAHRRVRENTASAIVDSSNRTAAAVAGRILSRHDMAQVNSLGWTSTRDFKLRSSTGAVTAHGRQPSFLNHKASTEGNLFCSTTQRQAREHEYGLPGLMHGKGIKGKAKWDEVMRR
jgi:hypothetical protein